MQNMHGYILIHYSNFVKLEFGEVMYVRLKIWLNYCYYINVTIFVPN